MSWPHVPCPPTTVDTALTDIIARATASSDPDAPRAAAEAARVQALSNPTTPDPELQVAIAWALSSTSTPQWGRAADELETVV